MSLAYNRYGFSHRLRDGKNHIYFKAVRTALAAL